jgi:GTP cyclohydrolase I
VPIDPLEALCRTLLVNLGEDPDREGLRDTPRRWARWWREFITTPEDAVEATTFEAVSDEMIVVGGLQVFSLCEHHLLPFVCDVTIGYVPRENGRMLGLSKFGRLARQQAGALQTQERLTHNIAHAIGTAVFTDNVAVLVRGRHTCMQMRGAKMDAVMTTSHTGGAFRDNAATRQEFLRLATP